MEGLLINIEPIVLFFKEIILSLIPLLCIAAVISLFFIKPIRKAGGLVLIITGISLCLSIVGFFIGVPAIFVGGFFMFIE
jgi:hypothetical protein